MSLKSRQILGVSVGIIVVSASAWASLVVWRTVQRDQQVITVPSRQERQDRFRESEFRGEDSKIRPRKVKETESPPVKSGNVEPQNQRASGADGGLPTGNPKQADETAAAAKLKEAQDFKSKGELAKAKKCCEEILSKYSETKTAAKAVELFNSLDN